MSSPRVISLRYGHDSLQCPVPAKADILEIREPEHALHLETFRDNVYRLLPTPVPKGHIAIVIADKTRLCGYPLVLPWLTTWLLEHGADRDHITFFIAYGTHAPQSDNESRSAYGTIYETYPCIHHRCTGSTQFTELGHTRQGTPVRIRSDLLEADLIITVGAISHHYFAGFGGGRKLLFPGLGEREAIYANHRLFLDPHRKTLASGCRPGQLIGNPLAEDLAEIDTMLPPYYSIHGLLDSHGQIAAYRFGSAYADFLSICAEYDALCRADTKKMYPLVLASAGGYPKDINMIQAHKAIDNASAFVRDGGSLILLAECAEGVGSDTFLPYFDMGCQRTAFAHLSNQYSGNGGTALAMMAKTDRIRISLVTSLPDHLCRRMGITRINLAEAARLAVDCNDMAVIPNASLLIR